MPSYLSDLTERPDLGKIFKKDFPGISFGKFVVADGNIIIQDCTPRLAPKDNLEATKSIRETLNQEDSMVTFQIVDGLSATQQLVGIIPKSTYENALIIFPGNGALSVREYLKITKPELTEGITVPARRTMIDKGKFEVWVDLPDNLPEGFSKILIIDDVVASGKTVNTLLLALARRIGILPPVNLACWLILAARDQDYRTGFSSIENVYASLVVKGNGVPNPPINSSSCLLDETGRYDTVKENYIKRYFQGDDILKRLRKIVGGEDK